jgi:uncharacterized membrane protein YqhA
MATDRASRVEKTFEAVLWHGRYVALVAVVGSALLAVGTLVVATVDALKLFTRMLTYVMPGLDPAACAAMRSGMISEIVKVLDIYLVAAIMLLFAMALYELFVSRIGAAEGSDFAERVLVVRSLDDLKHRLANLVLLILVTTFFQVALELNYRSPLDLLCLAVGIVLIGVTVHLGRGQGGAASSRGPSPGREPLSPAS